jgi:hypothetical protein
MPPDTPPGRRSDPGVEVTEAARGGIKAAGPSSITESTRKARQSLERHRASLELERLLGTYPYADIATTYGTTAALHRFLEHDGPALWSVAS